MPNTPTVVTPSATRATTVILVAFIALILCGWVGAEVAAIVHTGSPFTASPGVVVRSTLSAFAVPDRPATAWPATIADTLPGPTIYWLCTATAIAGPAALIWIGIARLGPQQGRGRRRIGVHTSARLARPAELAPLIVRRATSGRLIIGRIGRRLLATEAPTSHSHRRARTGDRTSVAVIGPTRCGKTANAISGILDWPGPAILSSVKTDLMSATSSWRASLGQVRVYDPTGATGVPSHGWSPLRGATTITGAQQAARALVDAGPRSGVENLDFFLRLAEQVLWPILHMGAISGGTMRDVTHWVFGQAAPDESTQLGQLLASALTDEDVDLRADAAEARDALLGTWTLDRRTRASAYATAQTLLGPWTDPAILRAGEFNEIDLDWLLGGNHTLYICSPLHEQQRLAPLFGGLLGDLINQAYERAARTNRPIRPTLVVLDEAANTPTRWLPHVASTCAGIGILLVTIWQSKAQLDAAYGTEADSVLTNHGTKLLFSGISDLSTLEYAARLVGDEEIIRRSTTIDRYDTRRSDSLSTTSVPLLPVHVLRQGRPGHALLVHGTLPPAHLISRPYYRERRLRRRVTPSHSPVLGIPGPAEGGT